MSVIHFQGLEIPPHKQRSSAQPISTIPEPNQFILPLNQHRGSSLIPCVQIGDHVHQGQVIATPKDSLEAQLHAPASGTVTAIELRPSSSTIGKEATSIVLANDFQGISVSKNPVLNWQVLDSQALCKHLAKGGIVGLGGAAFSLAKKLASHAQHTITQLIINGVECEPFISCDDRLMRQHAVEILQGIQIMLHATQTSRATIAIESDKPEAIVAIREALHTLNDPRVDLRVIQSTYPSGDEGQLISKLTGIELPSGKLPADIGIIVNNVSTVYACSRWILQGEPLTLRIVTVTGRAITKPGNYLLQVGTPIDHVLQHCGATFTAKQKLILGGAMMGTALPHSNYSITKSTNCLILSDDQELQPPSVEQPCIRCGECAQACPAQLLPQLLLAHSRQGNTAALKQLGLYDCIECGNCDYVCPSHIRLATRFREAKRIN